MRKWLVVLCVAAQVLVLGFMAGNRELIVRQGQSVYLRTAPIDPRDPFRGDYVRLAYAINRVPARLVKTSSKFSDLKKGRVVYAVLKEHSGGYHEFEFLTDERPQTGTFIKGRITNRWRPLNSQMVNVRYGIEQLFVEQGEGFDIEAKRGRRDEMQVPMEIELALSAKGVAVVKNFRWSHLGVRLALLRVNTFDQSAAAQSLTGTVPLSPKVRVTLENVSERPLLISDPGDNCGFALVSATQSATLYTSVSNACDSSSVSGHSFLTLEPQQQYSVDLDLSDPRWAMQSDVTKGEPVLGEIGKIAENDLFRIKYTPLTYSIGAKQTDTPALWVGDLYSQSFNARGRID